MSSANALSNSIERVIQALVSQKHASPSAQPPSAQSTSFPSSSTDAWNAAAGGMPSTSCPSAPQSSLEAPNDSSEGTSLAKALLEVIGAIDPKLQPALAQIGQQLGTGGGSSTGAAPTSSPGTGVAPTSSPGTGVAPTGSPGTCAAATAAAAAPMGTTQGTASGFENLQAAMQTDGVDPNSAEGHQILSMAMVEGDATKSTDPGCIGILNNNSQELEDGGLDPNQVKSLSGAQQLAASVKAEDTIYKKDGSMALEQDERAGGIGRNTGMTSYSQAVAGGMAKINSEANPYTSGDRFYDLNGVPGW